MISGCFAVTRRCGACSPARVHAASQARGGRAVLIGRSAASTARDGSGGGRGGEGAAAAGPGPAGGAGPAATSARQSPPGARASAASSRTLPGSCCANGRRPGAEAAERAWSRPVARTVSVSNTPPACPTPDTGATSTCTRGYNPVVFTLKVLFLQGGAHRDGAGPPRAGPFFT